MLQEGVFMLWKSEFFHMTEQLFQARLIGILIKICYTGSMENIKMLVSSMIRKEDGAFARVSFLRGKDWAEGIVPGGRIEKSEGFKEEEIEKLEAYLAGEEEMILKQAKGINPLRNLFELP